MQLSGETKQEQLNTVNFLFENYNNNKYIKYNYYTEKCFQVPEIAKFGINGR